LNSNRNEDRLNVNGNNWNDNNNGCAFGMTLAPKTFKMKSHSNLYQKIVSYNNLFLAYENARRNKAKKQYVIEFENNLNNNLKLLRTELLLHSYQPKPLKTFILRDPKTRKISKSHFRDRVIYHAICNIIEPIFDRTFIHDSCANRKGKGTLFALKRFKRFQRKTTKNCSSYGCCLKANIRHYFLEVNHNILLNIIKRKIKDEKVINLIKKILDNGKVKQCIGMPLGNLTSQFFANVYLNELDYYVKHQLRAKYYIRYVDDFIILHSSKKQLEEWKNKINNFLNNNLKLQLHPEKSKIIPLSRGVDFVGFRNFYYFRLLRKRNIRKMKSKINLYKNNQITKNKIIKIYQGWQAYAIWANTHNLREEMIKQLIEQNK
jgi:RNA-directed DNA polymerase